MVLDPKKLEEIANKVVDSIPPGVKQMAEGVDAKVKQALQHQLSRLDFVSREEFDVQTSVLQRTREKLIALETRMEELEKANSATAKIENSTD
ncbi:ubiquinone biosynthesis accessory factor UbiK [Planctobacterium marinum]|uniref:ubiquinone biosynthesis accessory factor UbiK n=1 Tax=Planctobacterium marinum TaxID=1631968 RepID=UPI001E447245|nr:accessory factor UbiK family protein [Planctobacterium marinum]MCC2606559.1 accessory factor UbiK family protein [Planctobacterium marinum]